MRPKLPVSSEPKGHCSGAQILALSRLHHPFFFVLPPLLLLFCIFRSLFYFVACSVQFAAHDFLLFANVVYSAPGWSSGSRLQSEANPAPLAEPKELRFYLPPTYIQGAYEFHKLPRLPEDVRVGTGAVVAHGWTTAKFPPCERVPRPLLPCPPAALLAALLFCWFVVLLRFTSLYPSRSLPAPLRLGLYVVFMFSPPLCFSIFSHLWLWASSGAPRRQVSGVLSFPFPPTWPKSSIEHRVSTHLAKIEYRVSSTWPKSGIEY